ncbi:ATP-binding protein [Arthrobacter sp. TWP1-1]|uniref:ATP-binding protein n=1 Tax=Arthrobacter sp. TWP1-1 TaxID=2804568 RepID=UPI003CE9E656
MGIRVKRLRLAGASETAPPYEVSFQPAGASEGYRPMSIIAGPSLTGKTTIVDFIAYCLGGSHLPPHDEVRLNVRSALLDVDLDDAPTVIERSAAGSASTFATAWNATLESIDTAAERRFPIEPTGDPDGLSQFVLAASNLDGIRLSDSVVKEDTGSAMLSIRDLFKVMIVRNERLDSKSLVYENDPHMVAQKYRQTIEVMFGVYDNEESVLAEQQKRVTQQRNKEQARLEALKITADRDYPDGLGALQQIVDQLFVQLTALGVQLQSLDAQRRSTESASVDIRQALETARRAESESRIRVRDRESLLDRLDALRMQYIDDRRKLSFLLDVDNLFDPLRVTVCPACFHPLEVAPSVDDGTCSLCHHVADESHPATASSHERISPLELNPAAERSSLVASELRAVNARINSLTDYMSRLTTDRDTLVHNADQATRHAIDAALAVDEITESPAPWLALRDRITNDITSTKLAKQAAETGVKAWKWVEKSEVLVASLQAEVSGLSQRRRKARPDRDHIVRLLSDRFAAILKDMGYPKLSNAYIDSNFIPYVRGLEYTNASSGGLVVIALAWNLALWEVAFEQDADAPGLLIIDSPQKNLGHNARPGDDFADATLVDRFYAHAKHWLATEGQGAQLIIVDNSPPESLSDDVVIRFTRRVDHYPYGLIADAVN